jgi:pyridoxamine 5'-phosphate oxidase
MKSGTKIVSSLRSEYISDDLNEVDLSSDPFDQFEKWMSEAINRNLNIPNAMHLATVGSDFRPSGRIVLLKGFDERGFTFFTNYESRKGKELGENNNASLTFFWSELFRQVRIEGEVYKLPSEESDSYFSDRPRESKLSALASEQSKPLKNKESLVQKVRELDNKYKDQTIVRPDFWGGYYLSPSYFEFWQGGAYRLHDRLTYKRDQSRKTWEMKRLYP